MSKAQQNRVDVRADYQRRVALAEETIANGPDLPTLRQAVGNADAAVSAFINKQNATGGVPFPGMAAKKPDPALLQERQELERALDDARTAFSAREAELTRAQRDRALLPLLTAHATAKDIAAEMQSLAADGDNAVKRLAAVDAMIAADQEAIENLKRRQQASVDEAAEAAITARLEGKTASISATVPVAGELAALEAAVAAAGRMRGKLTDEIATAATRAEDLRRQWLGARQLASRLDLDQWLADNATFINGYFAAQRATGRNLPEIEFQPDELEVARLATEISRECPPWRPGRVAVGTPTESQRPPASATQVAA